MGKIFLFALSCVPSRSSVWNFHVGRVAPQTQSTRALCGPAPTRLGFSARYLAAYDRKMFISTSWHRAARCAHFEEAASKSTNCNASPLLPFFIASAFRLRSFHFARLVHNSITNSPQLENLVGFCALGCAPRSVCALNIDKTQIDWRVCRLRSSAIVFVANMWNGKKTSK